MVTNSFGRLECDCLRILHWNRPSKARSSFKAGTIDYLKMGESITGRILTFVTLVSVHRVYLDFLFLFDISAHDLRLRFSITQDHLSDFNGNLLREVEIMHVSKLASCPDLN